MDGQDWETVVVGKRRTTELKRRPVMGVTAHHADETEELPLPKKALLSDSRHIIVAKRAENGWKQDQLNARCAFPVHTIRDIESGRLCPTPTQLNVLNRVLKTNLKYV